MADSSLYLVILSIAFAGPLLLSFDKKVAFYKSFRFLFPAIFLVAIFFIGWDVLFTSMGIWGFNPDYISGIYLFNLPLEECLFFIVIPYCCIFLYEVANAYIGRDVLDSYQNSISNFLLGFSASLAIINYDKWYTLSSLALVAVLIYYFQKLKNTRWLSRFYLAYAIICIPFLFVNGILTGTGIESPIVCYNDEENLGIRLFTIPLEDFFYGLGLVLSVTGIYEYLKEKQNIETQVS